MRRPRRTLPKTPVRTCVGCGRRAPSSELVRVTAGPGATLRVGGPGRGAWLCRASLRCLELAERRSSFARALRVPVGRGAVEGIAPILAGESPGPQAPYASGVVCEDGGPAS